MRNVYEDAENAKDKKAALGTDITIENFTSEEVNAIDVIDDLNDLSKKDQNTLLSVGVDSDESDRAGSFLQMDQSNIFTSELSDNIELMNTGAALEKYSWLENYLWNAVKPDADKYTAEAALKEKEDGTFSGYFVRSKPGTKEFFPVQACMFIADTDIMQTAHNIIIAEENSELHLITGCATGDDISSALHVGVSEIYLKPGSKITFTMVHNWAEQVEVRPRTAIKQGENSTYINNYILTSPVNSIQSYPTTYCEGANSKALFQSIMSGQKTSNIDMGSRAVLTGHNSSAEAISRAVANDSAQIFARGHIKGDKQEVKGHVECNGLVLSDDSSIYAVPILEANSTGLELSHEAAVGKIDEDEIYYLTSRGFSEEEAASMIVRGFLNMDITGLPPILADYTKKMIDMSVKGM